MAKKKPNPNRPRHPGLVTSLWLIAAACPSTNPAAECPSGTQQVSGLCRVQCTNDDECLLSERCKEDSCQPRNEAQPNIVLFRSLSPWVRIGEQANLEYQVLFANEVEISSTEVFETTTALEGTFRTSPLNETTTFVLTARAGNIITAIQELEIEVFPEGPIIEVFDVKPDSNGICGRVTVDFQVHDVDLQHDCPIRIEGTGVSLGCFSSATGTTEVDLLDVVDLSLTAIDTNGTRSTATVSARPSNICQLSTNPASNIPIGGTSIAHWTVRGTSDVTLFALISEDNGSPLPVAGESLSLAGRTVFSWRGPNVGTENEGSWLIEPKKAPQTNYALTALRPAEEGGWLVLDVQTTAVDTFTPELTLVTYSSTGLVPEDVDTSVFDTANAVEFFPYSVGGDVNGNYGFVPFPSAFEFYGRPYWGLIIHRTGYLTFLSDAQPPLSFEIGMPRRPNAQIAFYGAPKTWVGDARWFVFRDTVQIFLRNISFGGVTIPNVWIVFDLELTGTETIPILIVYSRFSGLLPADIAFETGIESHDGAQSTDLMFDDAAVSCQDMDCEDNECFACGPILPAGSAFGFWPTANSTL